MSSIRHLPELLDRQALGRLACRHINSLVECKYWSIPVIIRGCTWKCQTPCGSKVAWYVANLRRLVTTTVVAACRQCRAIIMLPVLERCVYLGTVVAVLYCLQVGTSYDRYCLENPTFSVDLLSASPWGKKRQGALGRPLWHVAMAGPLCRYARC